MKSPFVQRERARERESERARERELKKKTICVRCRRPVTQPRRLSPPFLSLVHSALLLLLPLLLLLLVSAVSSGEDFYDLLGIARQANNREIRRAFKKLALQMHPDKNQVSVERARELRFFIIYIRICTAVIAPVIPFETRCRVYSVSKIRVACEWETGCPGWCVCAVRVGGCVGCLVTLVPTT